jgi:hypothetical protein
MTKTQIAKFAILGLPAKNIHLYAVEVCRGLSLNTDEAVEVVGMLRTEMLATETGSDRWGDIREAKTAVNSYARDYRLR